MNNISDLIEDKKLAVIEALALHDDTGLTRADIDRATNVGSTTIQRYMEAFDAAGLLIKIGRRRNADIYRLDNRNPRIRFMMAALQGFTANVIQEEMRAHGIIPEEVQVETSTLEKEVIIEAPARSPYVGAVTGVITATGLTKTAIPTGGIVKETGVFAASNRLADSAGAAA